MEPIGANSYPHPNNVSAVYVDEKNEKVISFTKDMLINQLQRDCPAVYASFDELFKDELKDFSERLSIIYPIIFIGWKEAVDEDNELFKTCGILLQNALNTLVASIQTLRSGFRLQSGMMIRGSIETFALVMHLLTNPHDLENFKTGKFKSVKSISSAEKLLPIFGEIWGRLSNTLIHLNHSFHAELYPMGSFKNKEEEKPAITTLGVIAVAFWMAHITAEITFFNLVETPIYWTEISQEEGKFEFKSAEGELDWIGEMLNQ